MWLQSNISCCLCDVGAVDSQGTSQNSLQGAKRKARDGAAAGGRGKRPSRVNEDALLSQMGCSQQVRSSATVSMSMLNLTAIDVFAASDANTAKYVKIIASRTAATTIHSCQP